MVLSAVLKPTITRKLFQPNGDCVKSQIAFSDSIAIIYLFDPLYAF